MRKSETIERARQVLRVMHRASATEKARDSALIRRFD